MLPTLTSLRLSAPRLTTTKFLAANPGCWIQYYDDTGAKKPLTGTEDTRWDPRCDD